MRFNCSNILLSLALIVFLSACATTTKVEKGSLLYQSKDKDCEIQFYKDSKPKEQYDSIGNIESHISMNFFFGGKVQLENEGFKELKLKACSLGGDAVIIDDYLETSASEMTHLHVWATVIKFPK
jgi:hypothetical protein